MRRDPIATIRTAAEGRVPELVPVRHERMASSPFAFLRGTADVMALDLAATPTTGLRVQACGDAHILNFGEFSTPERNVIFDVNDFDETLPAPFEWDVKRLAASIDVAMRGNGVPAARRERAVTRAVGVYRREMTRYATLGALDLWYARIDVDDMISYFPSRFRELVRRDVARARRKTHARAYAKLTEVVDGRRRFVADPPLIVRIEDTEHDLDEVVGADRGLSQLALGPAPGALRSLPVRRRRAQGGRARERRHTLLGRALRGPRPPGRRPAGPPGEGSVSLGAGTGGRPRGRRASRPPHRHRPAAHAGRRGHLPRLDAGPAQPPSLLRSTALGRQGLGQPDRDGARQPRAVQRALRVGARTGPRTYRRRRS